jgi:Dullard-like phosphatase family protein
MDFFSIEKSESFPCILKIKTFNDSYEYNNIPSDLFDKQKLIEMIKELNVELKPKSKSINELFKYYFEHYNNKNSSYFIKQIKNLRKIKSEEVNIVNEYILKIKALKNNINLGLMKERKIKIKNFVYELWILFFRLNILDKFLYIIENDINSINNENKNTNENDINREDKNNAYIEMITKQYFSYYLLGLLLIYVFANIKNPKPNEHKIFKKLLIYFIEGNDYLLMNNYNKFYKNIIKCEEIIKQIIKIVYESIDSINISTLNKINKISYLFNNINLTTINNINEFADSEIFMTNIIVDLKYYSTFSSKNQNTIINTPYINEHPTKDYTLVLDLDETLIHFSINAQNEGHLFFRPYLFHFLNAVSEYYELIIFTAGLKEYAKIVLDLIENRMGKKIFDYRLYREHTEPNDEGIFIKDLSKIGRNLQKIIIVDNTKENYELQNDNGIEIKSYYGFDSKKMDLMEDNIILDNDKCLLELEKILIKIAEEKPKNLCLILKKYQKEILLKITNDENE